MQRLGAGGGKRGHWLSRSLVNGVTYIYSVVAQSSRFDTALLCKGSCFFGSPNDFLSKITHSMFSCVRHRVPSAVLLPNILAVSTRGRNTSDMLSRDMGALFVLNRIGRTCGEDILHGREGDMYTRGIVLSSHSALLRQIVIVCAHRVVR